MPLLSGHQGPVLRPAWSAQPAKRKSCEIRNPEDARGLGERAKSTFSESMGPKFFQWLIYTHSYTTSIPRNVFPGSARDVAAPQGAHIQESVSPWIPQTRIYFIPCVQETTDVESTDSETTDFEELAQSSKYLLKLLSFYLVFPFFWNGESG